MSIYKIFLSLAFFVIPVTEIDCSELETRYLKAAKKGNFSELKDCLLEGVDIDVQNKRDGRTALIYATKRGNTRLTEFLLKCGADINLKSKKKETAAQLAKKSKNKKLYQLIENICVEESEWYEYGKAKPEDCGVDVRVLGEMTQHIRESDKNILSLTISRYGKTIYEMYSQGTTKDHNFYLMSVTKSFVSALVGIAIDKGLIKGVETPVLEIFPKNIANPKKTKDKKNLTVDHILTMQAVKIPHAPDIKSSDEKKVWENWFRAPNQTQFVLEFPMPEQPGKTYHYNNGTAGLASSLIHYSSGVSTLSFAENNLFLPLGFRNYKWMHKDKVGVHFGGYGLKLRANDMQKFGILFLNKGIWNGRRILSEQWIKDSTKTRVQGNYGYYWWTFRFRPAIESYTASGWKGQYITVFPAEAIVVTMTSIIENEDSYPIYEKIIRDYILKSIISKKAIKSKNQDHEFLNNELKLLNQLNPRWKKSEKRMFPELKSK